MQKRRVKLIYNSCKVVLIFESIKDCSLFLNISPSTVSAYIKQGSCKMSDDLICLIQDTDEKANMIFKDEKWLCTDSENLFNRENNVKLIHDDHKYAPLIFKNIASCAKYLGMTEYEVKCCIFQGAKKTFIANFEIGFTDETVNTIEKDGKWLKMKNGEVEF